MCDARGDGHTGAAGHISRTSAARRLTWLGGIRGAALNVIWNRVWTRSHRILEMVETPRCGIKLRRGSGRRGGCGDCLVQHVVRPRNGRSSHGRLGGEGGMNGVSAVTPRNSPSTPVMALADLRKVMPPGRVKNQQELSARTEERQIRAMALRRSHSDELPENMRIDAVLQMLPLDVRDLMCQSLPELRRRGHVRRRPREDPGPCRGQGGRGRAEQRGDRGRT